MKQLNKFKVITIILIIFLISVFMFFLLKNSLEYFDYLTVKTPIITEPYIDSNFVDDNFNICIDNSNNVYDVALCYDNRIKELVNEKNEYTKLSNIYVEIPVNDVDHYFIGIVEYRTDIDVGFASYKSIVFSYPNNEFLKSKGGIDDSDSYNVVTDNEIRDDYYSDMEKYQNETIYYSENKNAYIFPLSDENSKYFLEILSFNNDNSEIFLEEINNYLQGIN